MQKAITIVDTNGDHNTMTALFLTRQILRKACTRMAAMPGGATTASIQMGGAMKWISLVLVLSMESAEMWDQKYTALYHCYPEWYPNDILSIKLAICSKWMWNCSLGGNQRPSYTFAILQLTGCYNLLLFQAQQRTQPNLQLQLPRKRRTAEANV